MCNKCAFIFFSFIAILLELKQGMAQSSVPKLKKSIDFVDLENFLRNTNLSIVLASTE